METVPLLTSDMGKKTVSVLAYTFLLPQRANSEYLLSIHPLRYCTSQLCAEAKISVLPHVLSTWSELMKTTSPAEKNMLQHTHLGFISDHIYRVTQPKLGGIWRVYIPRQPFAAAKIGVIGLILSSFAYLRSAMARFPFTVHCFVHCAVQ